MLKETDKQFVARFRKEWGNVDVVQDEDIERLLTLALRGAETQWRSIEADGDEILSILKRLYELCLHAKSDAFFNGVTDSTGSIDEGDVIASRYLDEAKRIIATFDPTHFIPLSALGEPKDE